MATLNHYSPEDVTVLFAGVHQISGFVEGTFVSISKDSPTYTSNESADGVPSRSYRNSNFYTVRLTLANTSDSNQVLSWAARADELTHKGKFPLIIKDQLGSTMFFSLTSWIESLPDVTFSSSITDREWVIKCSQATLNVGGNDSPSAMTEDALNAALGIAGGLF